MQKGWGKRQGMLSPGHDVNMFKRRRCKCIQEATSWQGTLANYLWCRAEAREQSCSMIRCTRNAQEYAVRKAKIYACACARTHIHMHTHTCTWTHTHSHAHTRTHTHTLTHTHTYTHKHTHTHTHTLTRTHIHMHMHTHIHTRK